MNTCVCCGAIIPEGGHICPPCGKGVSRDKYAKGYAKGYSDGVSRARNETALEVIEEIERLIVYRRMDGGLLDDYLEDDIHNLKQLYKGEGQ